MIINAASPAKKENSFGTSGWGVPQAEAGQKTGGNGQSLTAIAKLAPDADMGEGLSVHYSGEPTLSEADIRRMLTGWEKVCKSY